MWLLRGRKGGEGRRGERRKGALISANRSRRSPNG